MVISYDITKEHNTDITTKKY